MVVTLIVPALRKLRKEGVSIYLGLNSKVLPHPFPNQTAMSQIITLYPPLSQGGRGCLTLTSFPHEEQFLIVYTCDVQNKTATLSSKQG